MSGLIYVGGSKCDGAEAGQPGYTMSLKYALLGLLSYQPMSGYDLKAIFDRSINHFWTAGLSQIYPVLGEMVAAGLLTVSVQQQDGRPNRKIYSVTDAGRQALVSWLSEPQPLPHDRYTFLIQLFFSGAVPKEVVLDQLRHVRQLYSQRLECYKRRGQASVDQFRGQIGQGRDAAFWQLTVEYGIRLAQANVEWCDWAIAEVTKMPPYDCEAESKADGVATGGVPGGSGL